MSAIEITPVLKYKVAAGDLLFFQYNVGAPRRLDLIITDHRHKPYRFSDTREIDGAVNITTECFSLQTREVVEKYFDRPGEMKLVQTLFCGPNFSIWRAETLKEEKSSSPS